MSPQNLDGDEVAPLEGDNVTLAKEGASLVKAGMRSMILEGIFGDNYPDYGYTSHPILGDEEEAANPGIVIKLAQPYLLNRLRFRLLDKPWDNNGPPSYSYYVEMSLDQENWTRVCDYSNYSCSSWQFIVFPEMVARYIRIAGTFSSLNNYLDVVCVNAYLSKEKEVLDGKTGLWVPSCNVATPAIGARVLTGTMPENLLNGLTTGFDGARGYTNHFIGASGIKIQLAQPVVLSTLRLLLWNGDDRSYDYQIHVSTDGSNWKCVSNRRGQKAWQNLEFVPVPVVFIRIMGTHNTANNHFHVVHFECPSTENQIPTEDLFWGVYWGEDDFKHCESFVVV